MGQVPALLPGSKLQSSVQAGRCTPPQNYKFPDLPLKLTAEVGSGWLAWLVTEEGSRGMGPTVEAKITEFDWGWSAEFVSYGAGLGPVIGAETEEIGMSCSAWLYQRRGRDIRPRSCRWSWSRLGQDSIQGHRHGFSLAWALLLELELQRLD
jgi:hypothetical protein